MKLLTVYGTITQYDIKTAVGELVVTKDVNEEILSVGTKVNLSIPTDVVNVFEADGKNMSIMEDAG